MEKIANGIILKNAHERKVFSAAEMLSKRIGIEKCVERCRSAFGKVSEQRIRQIAEAAYGNTY